MKGYANSGHEDCKGCLTEVNGKCTYLYENLKGGICPCTECLVKGMCHEMCDEFKYFQSSASLSLIDN